MINSQIKVLRQEGFRPFESQGGLTILIDQISAEAKILEIRTLGYPSDNSLEEQQLIFNNLLSAIQLRDGVLLADILEYCWLPFVSKYNFKLEN